MPPPNGAHYWHREDWLEASRASDSWLAWNADGLQDMGKEGKGPGGMLSLIQPLLNSALIPHNSPLYLCGGGGGI